MSACEHCGGVLIEIRQGSTTRERCSECTFMRITFKMPEIGLRVQFTPLSVALVPKESK